MKIPGAMVNAMIQAALADANCHEYDMGLWTPRFRQIRLCTTISLIQNDMIAMDVL